MSGALMRKALDLGVKAGSGFAALLQRLQLSFFVFANILDSDLLAEMAEHIVIGFVHYNL